jgi:hypothetical protein
MTGQAKLTTIKPPARMPGLRTWPTDKLVQVRKVPHWDRQEVLLDGEPIGEIEFWTRRVTSRVGRTNLVREHAKRRIWQPISDEPHNPTYDRRWEAVRDVIENHQRAANIKLAASFRVPQTPSFEYEAPTDALEYS